MSSIFDDDYFIPPLSKYSLSFPNPRFASDEGLLAYGGDLEAKRVISAYSKGIFPWFNEGDPILWWSPNPRLVLYPKDIKVSKSFHKVLKKRDYIVKFDNNFERVIQNCAKIREQKEGTWLIKSMQEAYIKLYHLNYAHSVEVYRDSKLIGGLYCVAFGRAIFGESMFSLEANASKIALKALCDIALEKGYDFIDCQVPTAHLQSMGAKLIDRDIFLEELENALIGKSNKIENWKNYNWEYKNG